MGRARVLSEVRAMRFEEVLGRYQGGRLSCEEAADVLGMSVSSFFRWRRRYESAGTAGLVDGRVGKASARRVPVDEVAKVLELFETRYFDFTVTIIGAVRQHRAKRAGNLVEQWANQRSVALLIGRQRRGEDLTRVRIDREVQFAPPGALGLRAFPGATHPCRTPSAPWSR